MAADLTQADREHLDRLVDECVAENRKQGWIGEYDLQPGDLDYIIQARRGTLRDAKLTHAEGEYLDIPRWANAHVEWESE